MKAISQLVVNVFDLIEAEGRTLQSVVRGEARRVQTTATNMAFGLALLVMSLVLALAGLWLLAAGLMGWLETQVTRPLAASITGLVILGAAAGCLYGFKRLASRHNT